MTQEQAFLDAIRANPRDAANWLVFADWLDEADKEPIAHIIRCVGRMLEAEARLDLPVTLDPAERFGFLLGYHKEMTVVFHFLDGDNASCICPLCWRDRAATGIRELTQPLAGAMWPIRQALAGIGESFNWLLSAMLTCELDKMRPVQG